MAFDGTPIKTKPNETINSKKKIRDMIFKGPKRMNRNCGRPGKQIRVTLLSLRRYREVPYFLMWNMVPLDTFNAKRYKIYTKNFGTSLGLGNFSTNKVA